IRDGTIGSAQLSTFLHSQKLESGHPPRRPRGVTTELRRVGDARVEAITRVSDQEVDRQILELEFEPGSGTLALRHAQAMPTPGGAPAVAYARMTTRLWLAPDGRLYAHDSRRAMGAVAVVPFLVSSETWSRWEPATPETLEKQAAAHARQDEASRRAAELNRLRPKVGDRAPAFSGTDVLTGRPVTSADFGGKVLVLHSWSTRPGTQPPRALQKLHEKFHARGLEMVGLCRDPAGEREHVFALIRSRSLPWPQLHEGTGTRGEIFEAFHGALPPRYFVIDRQGHVAAILPTTAALEPAVTAALDAP
ncbi:MAG: peroxiredoxin family protein, partial [Opitutaceae bacterium]